MKLTKGKISKIRNKKRQSVKKYKKGKKTNKSKTFRKRKSVNLHRNTLKKIMGGDGEDENGKDENGKDENGKDENGKDENGKDEALEAIEIANRSANEAPEEASDKLAEDEAPAQDGDAELEEAKEQPVVALANSEEATRAEEASDKLAEDEAPAQDGDAELEEAKEQPVVALANSEEAPPVLEAPPVAPIVLEEAKEQPKEIEIQQNVEVPNLTILAESLDNLADYIAEKIAKKLNIQNTSSYSSGLNSDSFDAVENANTRIQ